MHCHACQRSIATLETQTSRCGGPGQRPRRLEPVHAPAPTVRVNQGLAPVLAAGSDYLRSEEEEQTLTIVGTVIGLHRQERTGPGPVTVKGHVDGWDSRSRSLRFELDERLYHEAVVAHDEGHTVAVQADVVRQPRKPFEVQRVRSFRTVTS